MDKKILALFDKLSHDNVISFRISPEKNADLIPTKEDEKVVLEFLNGLNLDEDCFKKDFSEDVFVATAISIYLFKIGTEKDRKPSKRFPFLKALSKIVTSLYNSKVISEKSYFATMTSIIDELFVSCFGRMFESFDEVHQLFFDGPDVQNRDKEEIQFLLGNYIDDDFAFEILIDLSHEMEKVNYLLFSKEVPSKQVELSKLVKHFMMQAYSLLEKKFSLIQGDLNWIEGYIASDLENEINLNPDLLRESLVRVLDFGKKFVSVARMILLTLWTITDGDDRIDIVEFFAKACDTFDTASGHMSVASEIYGFGYSYDLSFKVWNKYYKLYSHAYLGIFIGMEECAIFTNKEDEIRSISLAILRLTADAMDISFDVASKIARYCIIEKKLLDYHFAYIEKDIDEYYQVCLEKTLKFLYQYQCSHNFRRLLACNSVFKEMMLEDALQKKDYDVAKTAAYARYSNFFDIPTLYIVRKHSNKAYLSLLKKMSDCGRDSHVKTLSENENIQRFYGNEFCDELKKLCLRKNSESQGND